MGRHHRSYRSKNLAARKTLISRGNLFMALALLAVSYLGFLFAQLMVGE